MGKLAGMSVLNVKKVILKSIKEAFFFLQNFFMFFMFDPALFIFRVMKSASV